MLVNAFAEHVYTLSYSSLCAALQLHSQPHGLCPGQEMAICQYRIALIFRGPKILRLAVFDIFVERKRSAHPRA